MRDLRQYSAREWVSGVPAVAGFKEVRDAVLRDLYCRKGSPALERFLADHAHLTGGTFAVTIAFEQAWLIRLFIGHMRRHLPAVPVIVADNSRNETAPRAIEDACREGGASYIRLPANPIRNINRSHGTALNWTWRHIVRPLRPRVFAFLDHDIFPRAPVDVGALLGDQDFYGHRMDRGRGWAVWAGYSFYRFAALENRKLDFNPDMDRRLVAGGRNYRPLYRHYDPARLRFATCRRVATPLPGTGAVLHTEEIDGWVHFGGTSYQGAKLRAREHLEALLRAPTGGS
jgi:hypothetical protein